MFEPPAFEDDDEYREAVWPLNASLGDSVPRAVHKRYQQALLVKHRLPSAFAVQIRRALEAICKEQGETSTVLAQALTSLERRLNLPTTIRDVARFSRLLGNKGAHDGPDVTQKEAELLEDFFLAVVEYVYIAPAKLARYQEALASLNVNDSAVED